MKGLLTSFRHAIRGLGFIFRYERNARIHLVIMLLVIAASLYFQLSPLELVAVAFSIVIVFVAEILNSAIEELADLIWPAHDPRIRHVKDVTAAAVLVAAAAAALIGVVIFWHHVF